MPSPSDLSDATFRTAMEDADRLIDDSDYNAASRLLAETFVKLVQSRPDLASAPAENPHGNYAASRAARTVTWPPAGGVRVVYDTNGRPGLEYVRERFSMSEALGYFEFMMNLLWTLQKESV
jgi:hypothetical protein